MQENVRLSADPASIDTGTPGSELEAASPCPMKISLRRQISAGHCSHMRSKTPAMRIVQVYTDVLQLAIDLNGGDIVELALPKYPAELDNPDIPFVLLEDNYTRLYGTERPDWH